MHSPPLSLSGRAAATSLNFTLKTFLFVPLRRLLPLHRLLYSPSICICICLSCLYLYIVFVFLFALPSPSSDDDESNRRKVEVVAVDLCT